MTEESKKNLSIISPSMGEIFIQPRTVDSEVLGRAALVLFPNSIGAENREAALEWAATTQTPIFCQSASIQELEREGFGSYRFHRLEGFKEVDFQGGTLEFYPARPAQRDTLVREIWGVLGLRKKRNYHIAVRPKGEASILILSSTNIDRGEWELLMRSKPQLIIGLDLLSNEEWKKFAEKVQAKILFAGDLSTVHTSKRPGEQKDEDSWVANAGSF